MKIQFEQPERHCLNTAAWWQMGINPKYAGGWVEITGLFWKKCDTNKCKINVNKCKWNDLSYFSLAHSKPQFDLSTVVFI